MVQVMMTSQVLVVITVMVMTVTLSTAIPGHYFTTTNMVGQKLKSLLPDGKKSPIYTRQACEQICIDHPVCDGFSYSGFRKDCEIYKVKPGSTPIIEDMYNLYVRERSASEGFSKFGTSYVKFHFDRKDSYEAARSCAKGGGKLVSIKSKELNDLLTNEIMLRMISYSFIGLSDVEDEGVWKHADGSGLGYSNWDWHGVSPNTAKNCAMIQVDGTWMHTDCFNKFAYICQTPMF